MTDFPDLKIKALVSFPANVVDGTGVDVVKQNGNYQFNLAFDDFAPPTAIVSDPANQYALLWNVHTNQYALTQVAALSSTVSPSTSIPLPNATPGLPGGSLNYSREDHVHPTDTSRASATTQAVRFDTAQALTGETPPYGAVTQRAQARMNIYAAPLDALAYSGMQINGSMEVSQEKGTAITTTPSYIVDGWQLSTTGVQAPRVFQDTVNVQAGYFASLHLDSTIANPSPSLTLDRCHITQPIEGTRISRLAWGTPNAQPITIGFWAASNLAGQYGGSLRNGIASPNDRSCTFSYTLGGSGWEYKTITLPGDTGGTWTKANTLALILGFSALAGTNYTAPPGSWVSGTFTSAPGQINLFSATANYLLITGLVVLPGIEVPSAARSPLIMRPYDQELLTCKRYFQLTGSGWNGTWTAATSAQLSSPFVVEMRAIPSNVTLTTTSPIILEPSVSGRTGSGSTIAVSNQTPRGLIASITGFTGATQFHPAMMTGDYINLDARL